MRGYNAPGGVVLTETNEYNFELAGRNLHLEIGKMAKLAGGSVTVRYGETVVLVTACASSEPKDLDFLPFRVDFEERQYAQGKIPGSFFRREGKPTEEATLACRVVDRCLRPMFPQGFRNDIQVVATVLAYDADSAPEVCTLNGASLALCLSDVPFDGPVAGVKVGLMDDEIIVNPTEEQIKEGKLDLTVAGTKDAVSMVEANGDQVPEDRLLDAIFAGHEEIQRLVSLQEKIISDLDGGVEDLEPELVECPKEIKQAVRETASDKLRSTLFVDDKEERQAARREVSEFVHEELDEEFPEQIEFIDEALEELEKEIMRRTVVEDKRRVDGRSLDEVREISCEVAQLPRVHGSGLFTRGETQVLTVAALGPVGDRQMLDSLGHDEDLKRYMHHYNFPPFSTGETWPLRSPSRREIGHGALAEKALLPVVPDEDDFPYTLRLVSEVLSSNGSSSMASICGCTLALMDAGVKISAPVAGVATGLVQEDSETIILSDILGLEDHMGDMDFKVAGTRDGVTALQMDIKIAGVTRNILEKALARAREDRLFILERMAEAISEPREELSQNAPRIITLSVNPDKIRHIIGPGGKTINSIIDEYNVDIDVEDDGTVYISSEDGAGAKGAQERIRQLTADVEVGTIYKGEVKRIVDNLGAFVEVLPNREGLVHISKLDTDYVDSVEDSVSVGDDVVVKLVEVDDLDRLNFSREAVIKEMGRDKVEAIENGEESL